MALWTPYADVALDLSNNKHETPDRDRPFRPTVSDVIYETASPEVQEIRYYNYSHALRVPTPQISPNESLFYRKVPSPPSLDSLDVDSLSDDVEYQVFERDALRAMAEKNGGALLGNNPRMRRAVQTTQAADDSYRKQRERNNQAAKQSRDRRKLREVRLALQVSFLKKKIAALRTRAQERVCSRCQQHCRC